jgi:hypothetical protein
VATAANVTIQDGASVTITATTSDIPGRGVGTASLSGMVVDTIVPGDVTGLSVSVTDRRQTTFHLSWIAPSDGGQRVASYQVRVSKSPINAGNFDAATAVIYSGSPQSPGSADGVDVTDQLIETDYYFAVAAVDAAGNRGTIATTGPAKATFNTTILNTGVADDRARAVDGSESVDGDTFSDLVVGVSNGNAAYLYRGGASGYSDPPSVTFSGNPGTRFGADVAVVGDIDGDGMKDIAVSATLDGGPGTVYIFKGRASWPATLGVAQADYIIRANAATEPKFTGASLGVSIARLGDFNGDGADDFAIGAHRYNSNMGFVAVILGVTAGSPFPGTVTLPSDYGTRAIAVEGEDVASVTAEFFGQYVLGLGKFYTTTGNTLVVGAPGSSRVYAFRGQLGPTVLATAADHVLTGVAGTNTGRPLALIGQLSGNPVLGVGAPAFASNTGSASLYFGNPSVGPFGGTSSTFTDSAASSVGDAFGVGVIGSGFSGTVVGASFIGSNLPDVILSSIKEGGVTPANLYFLRGENVNASGNVVSRADIIYKLPAGWVGVNPDSGPIKDLNGDGYADIAIGEFQLATGYQGRVLVLW